MANGATALGHFVINIVQSGISRGSAGCYRRAHLKCQFIGFTVTLCVAGVLQVALNAIASRRGAVFALVGKNLDR